MISIAGDLSALEAFADWIEDLDGRSTAVTQRMTEVMAELTDERFLQRNEPNGTAWAPRKYVYRHPPLQKTGRLRSSFTRRWTADTATVSNATEYASYQFDGTARITARPVFPGDGDLPDTYMDRFRKIVEDEFGYEP